MTMLMGMVLSVTKPHLDDTQAAANTRGPPD